MTDFVRKETKKMVRRSAHAALLLRGICTGVFTFFGVAGLLFHTPHQNEGVWVATAHADAPSSGGNQVGCVFVTNGGDGGEDDSCGSGSGSDGSSSGDDDDDGGGDDDS